MVEVGKRPGRVVGVEKRMEGGWDYGAEVEGEVPDGQESLNAFWNC